MSRRREPPVRPEEMSLLFDVWLVGHVISGLVDGALEGREMSGDDFGLYSLLRVFGPATPSQIARWTGMRSTTVSAALKRMAARGHSERTAMPGDKRSYLVGLSDTGRKAHLDAAPPFLAVMQRVSNELDHEEWTQRLALQRLDAALREAAELDARPYAVESQPGMATSANLSYSGEPLRPAQGKAVRNYIDFIRTKEA